MDGRSLEPKQEGWAPCCRLLMPRWSWRNLLLTRLLPRCGRPLCWARSNWTTSAGKAGLGYCASAAGKKSPAKPSRGTRLQNSGHPPPPRFPQFRPREGRRRSLKVEVKSRPESPNVKPGFGDPPADDRVIQEMPTCAPLQASSEDTIWRSAISLGISRPSCGPQLRPESTAAPPQNGESRSSVSHAYLMAVLGKARLALCMI